MKVFPVILLLCLLGFLEPKTVFSQDSTCTLEMAQIGCPGRAFVGSYVEPQKGLGPGCVGIEHFIFADGCSSYCKKCLVLNEQKSFNMSRTLNVIYGKIRSVIDGSPDYAEGKLLFEVKPTAVTGVRGAGEFDVAYGLNGFVVPSKGYVSLDLSIPKVAGGDEQIFNEFLVHFLIDKGNPQLNAGKFLWVDNGSDELLFFYALADMVDGNLLSAAIPKSAFTDAGDSYTITLKPYVSEGAVGSVFFSPERAYPATLGTVSGMAFVAFENDSLSSWSLASDTLRAPATKRANVAAVVEGPAVLGLEVSWPTPGATVIAVDGVRLATETIGVPDVGVFKAYEGLAIPSGRHVLSLDFSPQAAANGDVVVRNIALVAPAPAVPGKGTLEISDFGQEKCYNNTSEISCPQAGQAFYGQDGNHTGKRQSLVKGADNIVIDNLTKLVWTGGVDVSGAKNWVEAVTYCADLSSGGYTDWRLPTLLEVSTITAASGTACLNPDYFSLSGYSGYFWVADVFPFYEGAYAWEVDFGTGRSAINGKLNTFPVLCVRGESLSGGQYVKHKTSSLMNATTGLMWEVNSSAGLMQWENALAYCEGRTTDGYTDWHLPDKHQLESLINTQWKEPTLDNQFAINNAQFENYWTSSTDVLSPEKAFVVNFNYGYTALYGKSTSTQYARCVRKTGERGVVLPSVSLMLEEK